MIARRRINPTIPQRYGPIQGLPPMTAALAESVSASEKAADDVIASMATRIRAETEAHATGQPITELEAARIREGIARVLDDTFGASRERASAALLGSTIVAEAHNARIREARAFLATEVAPHARRDPVLRAAMGLTTRDLEELEDAT